MKIILKEENSVVVKQSCLLGTILEIGVGKEGAVYKVRTIDLEIGYYKETDLIPDMFQHMEHLPKEVYAVLEKYSEMDESYEVCSALLQELEALDYTFDYYLDAEPYFLRKKDLVVLK